MQAMRNKGVKKLKFSLPNFFFFSVSCVHFKPSIKLNIINIKIISQTISLKGLFLSKKRGGGTGNAAKVHCSNTFVLAILVEDAFYSLSLKTTLKKGHACMFYALHQ